MDFLSMLQGGMNPQMSQQVQQPTRNPQQTLQMAPTQNPQAGRQLNMIPQQRSPLQVGPARRGPRGAAWSGIQPSTGLDGTLQGNPDINLQGGEVNPGYIPLQNSGRGGPGYGANLQPTHNPQDPMAILRSLLGL